MFSLVAVSSSLGSAACSHKHQCLRRQSSSCPTVLLREQEATCITGLLSLVLGKCQDMCLELLSERPALFRTRSRRSQGHATLANHYYFFLYLSCRSVKFIVRQTGALHCLSFVNSPTILSTHLVTIFIFFSNCENRSTPEAPLLSVSRSQAWPAAAFALCTLAVCFMRFLSLINFLLRGWAPTWTMLRGATVSNFWWSTKGRP